MVHDAGVKPEIITLYRELIASERFETRIYAMVTGLEPGDWFRRGPSIDRRHRLTVRAVKLIADGALGSRGAALLEDYADEPGNRGLLVPRPSDCMPSPARPRRLASRRPYTRSETGRTARCSTSSSAWSAKIPRARDLRLRDEHAQVIDASDIARFARLGVIASVQATHCTSDMPWAPRRLGDARIAEGAYAWRKLVASGAALAQGSDFPVERPDPLLGFYAAITRQGTDGQPAGGWAPDQRLTRAEALRAMTVGAAYAAHAERDLGSIEPGKLADFVELSRDIMQVDPRDVLSTTVLRTVVGGRTVYER